ncbi:hypothetical protein ABK040_008041 [Willaertia magna]
MNGIFLSITLLFLMLSGSFLAQEVCFKNKKLDCQFYVTLVRNNWLSSAVNVQILSILLEEKLGACVKIKDLTVEEGMEFLSNDLENGPKLNMEYWSASRAAEFEEYVVKRKFVIDMGSLGVKGQIGWFILDYMLKENNYGLDTYSAYRHFDAAKYVSTNNTYPFGRFLSAPKSWASKDDQIIKNLDLKLVVENAPEEDAEKHILSQIEEAVTNKKPLLFYFWTPHQAFAKYKLRKVFLPEASKECHSFETIANGGVNCDYPTEDLLKLSSKNIEDYPDIKYLVSHFGYGNSDQIKIMGQITYENRSIYNASCQWLRENELVWKGWVLNNNAMANSTIIAIFSSLGGLVVLIIVFGILFFVIYHYALIKQKQRAMRHAPKDPPLAIMFTDIQNSTKLWAALGKKMEKILSVHNEIIRKNIEIFSGYEVKTQGDSFMVAFKNPSQALLCAVKIQRDLILGKWDEELISEESDWDDLKSIVWNGKHVYRGPRVRIGIHYGQTLEAKYDPTTKRIDYFGNDVNMASRVEGIAIGGRIVVSADFVRAVKSHIMKNTADKVFDRYRIRVENEEIEFSFLGNFELKGYNGLFRIFWVKDLNFERTKYIDEFENPQALRQSAIFDDVSLATGDTPKKYSTNTIVPVNISTSFINIVDDLSMSTIGVKQFVPEGDTSGIKKLLHSYLENPSQVDEQDKSLLFQKLLLWKGEKVENLNPNETNPRDSIDSPLVTYSTDLSSAGFYDKLLLVLQKHSVDEQIDRYYNKGDNNV